MNAVSGFSTSSEAPAPLDVARIRRTIAQLREHLTEAVRLLGELYDARAWVTLGLPSWEALCEQELPELGQLLSAADRRAVVVELRRGGASLRAAAAPVKVSVGSAKAWCDDAGVRPEKTTSLDGRIRPAEGVKQSVNTPRLSNVARAIIVIREAGADGVTVHQLAKRLRLNQCQVGPLLCRLAKDGRLEYRRPAKRGQTGTYVAAR